MTFEEKSVFSEIKFKVSCHTAESVLQFNHCFFLMMKVVTCVAPVNIAVIKYCE